MPRGYIRQKERPVLYFESEKEAPPFYRETYKAVNVPQGLLDQYEEAIENVAQIEGILFQIREKNQTVRKTTSTKNII